MTSVVAFSYPGSVNDLRTEHLLFDRGEQRILTNRRAPGPGGLILSSDRIEVVPHPGAISFEPCSDLRKKTGRVAGAALMPVKGEPPSLVYMSHRSPFGG